MARNRHQVVQPLVYFAMVVMIVPLGLDPEPEVLARLGPAVIWTAVVLAVILSLDRLLASDAEDGSLELLLTAPVSLGLMLAIKVLVHWLVLGVMLALGGAIAAGVYGLSLDGVVVAGASVLIGTLGLTALGLVAASLTVGLSRGGVLIALILLPLYVPLLVFATGAIGAIEQGLPARGPLYFCAALSVAYATVGPVLAAGALRLSFD